MVEYEIVQHYSRQFSKKMDTICKTLLFVKKYSVQGKMKDLIQKEYRDVKIYGHLLIETFKLLEKTP